MVELTDTCCIIYYICGSGKGQYKFIYRKEVDLFIMDPDSSSLSILLILLILGGGYFAASETAFASVNPIRIRHRAENGERRAKRAEFILEHFNKALSTVLIGNNLMHIGTASIATYLVTVRWGEGYTAYSTLVTTLVVFLFAELIPKQVAKDRPEPVALFFAGSLYWLVRILSPISAAFDTLSDGIGKLFKSQPEPTVTEDELLEMIDELGDTDGDDCQRSELLRSALEFTDTAVGEIITPLSEVCSIEINMPAKDVLEIIRNSKFSRLPVYLKSPDNLLGVLDTRSYIKCYLADPESTAVSRLMKKTLFVPAERDIDSLFDEMSHSRTHMCIVTDMQKRAVGIVTMEDILEELVGEIWDERDSDSKREEALA